MTDHHHLLGKIKDFVSEIFRSKADSPYVYHNLKHTEDVVEAAIRIANHYQLNNDDFFVVTAAAWFHDTGYFTDCKQHENKGAEIAAEFLAPNKVDAAIIKKVEACILATKMPQKPTNQLENIICDADLFHFGTDDFSKKNKLMREEYNNLHSDKQISKSQWRDKTITLLEGHHYHTDYCHLLLDDQKLKNLDKLKSKTYEEDIKTAEPALQEPIIAGKPQEIKEEVADAKKSKKDRPDKGIETMFRISSSNHSRLSDMADNKAHILITVNSIILSAVISLVLRKIENNGFLTLPSFILLIVSLVTIIFAILATRPSIPNGTFSKKEIDEKRVNLLFFGNFYRMSLTDYTDAMVKVMNDSEFLYDNLIRDVYFQGIVLGKKYRLLRVAYNIFMVGLTISVIAFIVSSAMATKTL
ncbi:MAG TPA: Pycsar system effector family protein [Mucilaginibacter sp.]|nr:Pycsar system effector family protein [Mucilaginibacter sp.]